MRTALLFLIALVALPVHADTKTVTWANATKNTDGSTIAASGAGSLVRTTVEYGTCNAAKTGIASKAGEIFVAAPATTLQLALVVVQQYCLDAFHSNTFATTFAPGAPGNSAASAVALTTVNPPSPAPPTGLTVADPALTAYGLQQSPDKITTYPVGRVAAATACDGTQSVNGLYRVPLAAVTWLGDVRPAVVFAQCSSGG